MNIDWKLPRFEDFDVTEFAAKAAPVLVPIAPMTVAIIGLAEGLQVGAGWAYIPAALSGTGMELVGMVASHLLTENILCKNRGRAAAAGALLALYAGFAMWAISNTAKPGIYMAFVAISIAAYLLAALWRYNHQEAAKVAADDEQKRRDEALERANRIADEQAALDRKRQELELWERAQRAEAERKAQEIALEQERTKQARAQARAQVAPKVSPIITKVSESFGGDWRRVPSEHRAKIAGMTTAEIMANYSVSQRTAENWKNYALKSGIIN